MFIDFEPISLKKSLAAVQNIMITKNVFLKYKVVKSNDNFSIVFPKNNHNNHNCSNTKSMNWKLLDCFTNNKKKGNKWALFCKEIENIYWQISVCFYLDILSFHESILFLGTEKKGLTQISHTVSYYEYDALYSYSGLCQNFVFVFNKFLCG